VYWIVLVLKEIGTGFQIEPVMRHGIDSNPK
jgi:hypothetical protein